MTIRAVVRGVGHYLPARVVPNSEFEGQVDTTDEWIRSRTGIERRHFAADGEATSDLGAAAARAALADAGLTASDLDAIVVATSTPDYTFPSVATMIQSKIGMTGGFAFDVQAVCAGFVFALSNANALILSGQANRVMVIGAETFSRILDWTDRTTSVLFGDGAGALILERQEGNGTAADRGILSTDLHSDGTYRDLLYVDGGVSTTGKSGLLRMQGNQVFRHAVEKLAQTAHCVGKGGVERRGCRLDRAASGQYPHHRRHRETDAGSHGTGCGDGARPRQYLGGIDPAGPVGGQGARPDQDRRSSGDRSNRRRACLGRGRPALVI
jgi:3-oxoacyl-[acyl-carrier-protein] synthase-3